MLGGQWVVDANHLAPGKIGQCPAEHFGPGHAPAVIGAAVKVQHRWQRLPRQRGQPVATGRYPVDNQVFNLQRVLGDVFL